jgi:hypothetical protein
MADFARELCVRAFRSVCSALGTTTLGFAVWVVISPFALLILELGQRGWKEPRRYISENAVNGLLTTGILWSAFFLWHLFYVVPNEISNQGAHTHATAPVPPGAPAMGFEQRDNETLKVISSLKEQVAQQGPWELSSTQLKQMIEAVRMAGPIDLSHSESTIEMDVFYSNTPDSRYIANQLFQVAKSGGLTRIGGNNGLTSAFEGIQCGAQAGSKPAVFICKAFARAVPEIELMIVHRTSPADKSPMIRLTVGSRRKPKTRG